MATERKSRIPHKLAEDVAILSDITPEAAEEALAAALDAPIATVGASVEGEEVEFAIHRDSRTGAMAAVAALVQKRTDDGER